MRCIERLSEYYRKGANMEHDYSVTWNQVKNLVNVMIEDHNEKVAMADIIRAVNQAWIILYDNLHEKYDGL